VVNYGRVNTTSAGAWAISNKTSSERLRSQLVRGGVDEDKVAQMDRGELKAVAAEIEVERKEGEDARQKPLPDDGRSVFGRLGGLHINPTRMRCYK